MQAWAAMEKAATEGNRMTRRRAAWTLATALVALCLGLSVSACGKKGPPEQPKDKSGKESDHPRAYPNPKSY